MHTVVGFSLLCTQAFVVGIPSEDVGSTYHISMVGKCIFTNTSQLLDNYFAESYHAFRGRPAREWAVCVGGLPRFASWLCEDGDRGADPVSPWIQVSIPCALHAYCLHLCSARDTIRAMFRRSLRVMGTVRHMCVYWMPRMWKRRTEGRDERAEDGG